MIFDPTEITKVFGRHGDALLDPTDRVSVGWTLLTRQNCSLTNFAMDYFGWEATGPAADSSTIGDYIPRKSAKLWLKANARYIEMNRRRGSV